MIRASLTVVPRRLPALWAKITVFAAVVGVAAVASTVVSFFVGPSLLSSNHLQVSLSNPSALRMVIAAGEYLLAVGMIVVALRALLRNAAAGISPWSDWLW